MIKNGNISSDFAHVIAGVPQGSILGPTLFLLFINDLPLVVEHCSTDMFADDTTIHTSGTDPTNNNINLQADLNSIATWCEQHKMVINSNKTTSMSIGTRQKLSTVPNLSLSLGQSQLENVTCQKLLGLNIDQNLLWTQHVDYVCSNISSRVSLLRQLSQYVPTEVQKQFYNGYILPLLDYGSNTWGSTSVANMTRLLKLQKRAARVILNADFLTPSKEMFQALGWMTVSDRHTYNKAVMTYKAINGLLLNIYLSC